MTMYNNLTVNERVTLAQELATTIGDPIDNNNFYMAIGRNLPWSMNDTLVPNNQQSTDILNTLYKHFVAMKLITASDISLVVRRNDWTNGVFYTAYSNSLPMFTTSLTTNANGTITLNVGSNTTIIGTNTTFLLDFVNNDILQIPGDGITEFPQQREIISISSNTQMQVNLAFTDIVIANTPQLISNTYPNYSYNFYVRNTYDQVFVCLGNNSGSVSTSMPQISIGGDLPSDSYIVTADGYFWKYLYTMSAGQKQLFFTQEWMPIGSDPAVTASVVSGALSVINIINAGTGYNNSSATFSAPIITVIGDGTGANISAQVNATGSIIGINVLNGGQDYTTANVIVAGGATGTNANLQAVISPEGGWGSNTALELGATSVMISVELDDTEDGTIPTVDVLGDYFTYRNICIVANPTFANGSIAASLNYDLTTILPLPSNTAYGMNDVIYQSSNGNIVSASFVANVVYFDISTFNLHINNITGSFVPGQPLYSTNTSLISVSASISPSVIEPFSGEIEYIENRLPIQRSPGQTENLKIVIGF
jgi:hypothetical protein